MDTSLNRARTRYVLAFVSMIVFAVALVGCGKIFNFVKNATFKTIEQDGDTFAEMTTILDIGNFEFPVVNLPIYDRKNPENELGLLSLKPALGGGSELGVSVNLSQALKIQSEESALLPNGKALPIGGIASLNVISLGIAKNSRLYVAAGNGAAMLGVALVVKQFDGIATRIPLSLNLFPSFKSGKKLRGVAGMFTSPNTGENGIGMFLDASRVADPTIIHPSGVRILSSAVKLNMAGEQPARMDHEIRVYQNLQKLNRKKTVIEIQ